MRRNEVSGSGILAGVRLYPLVVFPNNDEKLQDV
jgi:hypothetical protein